jgi:hypothetical protein
MTPEHEAALVEAVRVGYRAALEAHYRLLRASQPGTLRMLEMLAAEILGVLEAAAIPTVHVRPNATGSACINCGHAFTADDVRGYYGPPGAAGVGPFCDTCYACIKGHEEPAAIRATRERKARRRARR